MDRETIKSDIETLKTQLEDAIELEKTDIIEEIKKKYCELVKNHDDAIEYVNNYVKISGYEEVELEIKKYKNDSEVENTAKIEQYDSIKIITCIKPTKQVKKLLSIITKFLNRYFDFETYEGSELPLNNKGLKEYSFIFSAKRSLETLKNEYYDIKKKYKDIKKQYEELENKEYRIIEKLNNRYIELVKNHEDALKYLREYLKFNKLKYSLTIKKYNTDECYSFDDDEEVEASADHTQYKTLVIIVKDTIRTGDDKWIFEDTITKLLDPYFSYEYSKNDDNPYYEGEIKNFTMYFTCK